MITSQELQAVQAELFWLQSQPARIRSETATQQLVSRIAKLYETELPKGFFCDLGDGWTGHRLWFEMLTAMQRLAYDLLIESRHAK